MTTCKSCGNDVTGRKFCSECGTPVIPTSTPGASGQFTSSYPCPHCSGAVKPGAAFCNHCGSSLTQPSSVQQAPPPPPALLSCPACNEQVATGNAFCNQCGHDMRTPVSAQSTAGSALFCTNCGRQNAAGTRFCGGCGGQLVPGAAAAQTGYGSSGPYQQQPQYSQYQQPYQPPQYQQQAQYPQQNNPQYAQQYGPGYQPQPMMGQPQMVLRCPTCMAMAPLGTASCVSCRTSLAGIVPTPAPMPGQGQQQGGFLQGNAGKYAMGALGGAAAMLGGEMLLHGVENSIEDRVEGDMGRGGYRHHHHHREEGLLGGLGELADDIGLI